MWTGNALFVPDEPVTEQFDVPGLFPLQYKE